MKTLDVSKRNPLLPLAFFALAGLAMLLGPRAVDRAEETSLADSADSHVMQLSTAGARSIDTPVAESGAPEAHAFGFELLNMGHWDLAEPVLVGACDTGDLTACQVLANEYAKLGRDADADERFMTACTGGQLQGCRSILDRLGTIETTRMAAVSRLEHDCLDFENGSACELLAGSLWARSIPKLARRYTGLACSRGIQTSCRASVAANMAEGR